MKRWDGEENQNVRKCLLKTTVEGSTNNDIWFFNIFSWRLFILPSTSGSLEQFIEVHFKGRCVNFAENWEMLKIIWFRLWGGISVFKGGEKKLGLHGRTGKNNIFMGDLISWYKVGHRICEMERWSRMIKGDDWGSHKVREGRVWLDSELFLSLNWIEFLYSISNF